MTTPGYPQGVRWLVLVNLVEASQAQIDHFIENLTEGGTNNRPIQKTHGRAILKPPAMRRCQSALGYWPLARISHQAAQQADMALAIWSKARMIQNTVCYSSMPITVQASLRVRKLALHSNRRYCYAFRSRAALTNTNPAPAPVILVRNAG